MADETPQWEPPRRPPQAPRSGWRYALILAVVCTAVVAAAAAGWRFARTSSAPAAGPVILISIDTLRADHLPLYGYPKLRTRAFEALAAEGIVFDHAYAHSPESLPSHTSILSGRLPFETGVRGDQGFTLRPDVTLLPQLLKSRGYATGAVVSAGLLRRETGLGEHFDFYDSSMAEGLPADEAAGARRAGEESVAIARKWISSLSSPRFFLFLHIDEPHAPCAAPDRFAQYGPYDGEIVYSDEIVGHFLDWLKGRGLYDRATIVLLSDHGEGLGDHGEQEHGLFLYDETIRVPLVVKLPRDVNHGRRVAQPVQHIDLVPTVLDLLDAPPVAGLRGRSLKRLLRGDSVVLADPAIYAESLLGEQEFGWSSIRSLTGKGFRYVEAPREELYDLRGDPGERTNVVDQRTDVAQDLREALAGIAGGATPEPPPAPAPGERRSKVAGTRTPVDPKDKIAVYEKYREALALETQGRFWDAAAAYREFLADQSSVVRVWLRLGSLLVRSNRFDEAADTFSRAMKIEPNNVDAACGAADAMLRLGKLDAARSQAERSERLAPAPAREMLTRIALQRNDVDEANRQASLAREAGSTVPMSDLVAGVQLYRAGKYEEAVERLRNVARQAPKNWNGLADVQRYLADSFGRLEQYPEAEAAWNEVLRLMPGSIDARVSLATMYRAQHRTDAAAQAIEDLVRQSPTLEGYGAAARLWMMFGNKDRYDELRRESKARFGREAPRPRPETR